MFWEGGGGQTLAENNYGSMLTLVDSYDKSCNNIEGNYYFTADSCSVTYTVTEPIKHAHSYLQWSYHL